MLGIRLYKLLEWSKALFNPAPRKEQHYSILGGRRSFS